jgi:hypothetical protein
MSNTGPDIGDQLKRDVEKYRRLQRVGEDGWDIPTMMEYTFWTLAILSVVGMLVWMFVFTPVGSEAGVTWLLGSIGPMLAFTILALITRRLPEV